MMYIADLLFWWILCTLSLLIIRKTTAETPSLPMMKLSVNNNAEKCIAITRRRLTVKARNHWVITLGDCDDDNSDLLMLWRYESIITENGVGVKIVNINHPDWQLCTEFGSNTDANMHFLRVISNTLDHEDSTEHNIRNRNCINWSIKELDKERMIYYPYQVNLNKYILAPTEYTTKWTALVRPGIFMIEFEMDGDKIHTNDEEIEELRKRSQSFRTKLNIFAGGRAIAGAALVGLLSVPPITAAVAGTVVPTLWAAYGLGLTGGISATVAGQASGFKNTDRRAFLVEKRAKEFDVNDKGGRGFMEYVRDKRKQWMRKQRQGTAN